MTTNEADRTDDRAPASDAFAPGEEPADESAPPDGRADELEVDEPPAEHMADEIEEHNGTRPSSDAERQGPDIETGNAGTGRGDAAPRGDEPFVEADATRYQDRWYEIQTGFVDEPGHAVQSAGELLSEVIDDLNRRLTTELESLDARQGASGDVSTEDLRVTFQRYRSFFDRLMMA